MALAKCRECGAQISTEARACPHCGKKDPTGRHTSPAAWGCLAVIVLAIILATLEPDSPRTNTPSTIPPAQAEALCQTAITAKLRSPSTADFPAFRQIWAANDTAAMIVGVVDAQNGFGATVRDSLICLFRRSAKSGDWRLTRSAVAPR